MLFTDGALLLAVQVQKVAQGFCQIVDRVYGQLDAEVCGVGVGDRDLQHSFLCSGLARAGVLRCRRATDRAIARVFVP